MIVRPETGSRVEFIYLARPKPWSINVGDVLGIEAEDGEVRVNCLIDPKAAKSSVDYDSINNQVYVEVKDASGRPVMEAWCPIISSYKFKATVGLR